MEIISKLQNSIAVAAQSIGIENAEVSFEHPADLSHGDLSTNIAMQHAKNLGINPRELAQKIVDALGQLDGVEKTEVAGPGFINLYFSKDFFADSVARAVEQGDQYGVNKIGQGKKAIVEYTDPNPFKLLHIGHLMSNTIGESLSRLVQVSGFDVRRANYQGDVGMHVANAIWGMIDMGLGNVPFGASLAEQVAYLGKAYAHGATAYKNGENTKEAQAINKAIYEKTNPEINELYDWGRKASLDYFETQYAMLGTKFDFYFFESEAGPFGKELVLEFLEKGVFEEGDGGAVIFDGEKHGLHKRVFLNKEGLPTYEAKELGLAKLKSEKFDYDMSIIVTANEIDEYFKVLLKAMSFVFPELAEKTKHISHGMMKLPTGKMSSRTGDVIAASDLVDTIKEAVRERVEEKENETLVEQVAIAALKFSILKQDSSKDIVYDLEKSVSFEGDSGPYLQYTVVRINSVLEKAAAENMTPDAAAEHANVTEVEKYIYRFPEIVEQSFAESAPHHVAQYLLELARSFNSWYAATKLVDAENAETPYNLAIAQSVMRTIKNGLWMLGIQSPDKM